METEEIIAQLNCSEIYARHSCGGEFKLSKAFLFDGTKPFPHEGKDSVKKEFYRSLTLNYP